MAKDKAPVATTIEEVRQHLTGLGFRLDGAYFDDMEGQLRKRSPRFAMADKALKQKGITIVKEVDATLPDDTGGGRTFGSKDQKVRGIRINVSVIKEGFTVVDVYVHEYGHVYEDNGGPDCETLMHNVQDDLGIRRTPRTHDYKKGRID